MSGSLDNAFNEYNNFENLCKNSPKKSNGLTDFLKVTTSNGDSDIYDGKGNRLSYKNKEEMYNEICMRT